MKNILITGGAGYIGSHVVNEVDNAGYRPVIIDNFSNSDETAITRIETLIGKPLCFYKSDYQDTTKLKEILQKESIDGVIHIAASKAVGESVENPLKYYQNNVAGFVELLEVMHNVGINIFVFSSSASVYGSSSTAIATESTPCMPESPYGWSKYMDEIILRDTCAANNTFKGIALRYFNVVGSHESGIIGEMPKGSPQNLLPIITQAALSQKPFTIFGTDYPTTDGTAERDYIHVVDVAKAHVAALKNLFNMNAGKYSFYNLSTGKPTTVMTLLKTFEHINNIRVPYKRGPRRSGDPASIYASPKKAAAELGWHAQHTIEEAVMSAWHWKQKQNIDLDFYQLHRLG